MLGYGYLFEKGHLTVALLILAIGMTLKLVVHLPFLKVEKTLKDQEMRAVKIGTESSTG